MHVRIPSRVIAATLELALLVSTFSPVEATPLKLNDLSPLLELSPHHRDQNQQIISHPSSSLLSEPISQSPTTTTSSSNTNTNTISAFDSDTDSDTDSDSDSDSQSTTSYSDTWSSSSSTTCTYNPTLNPLPASQSANLFACISGFETDKWDGGHCGGQTFYKGRNSFWFPTSTDPGTFSDLELDSGAVLVEGEHVGGGNGGGKKKSNGVVGRNKGEAKGAKECYQECESCLVNAVVDGANKVECRVSRGVLDVSRCWIGIE